MPLFDSHCHLTSDDFSDDLGEVLSRARAAGVAYLTCIASNPDDALAAIAIAESDSGVFATAGIHPHEAPAADDALVARVRPLLDHPQVVAVGECGLDYHYGADTRDRQLPVFEAQIGFARETGLPLVVHSRSADDDMVGFLRGAARETRGVLHCFSGGDALLDAALDAGWYVSFAGVVTFRKFDRADAVRRVPADRILVETDSPYLAPVPHRGRRNEPAFVDATARELAALRGEDFEGFAARTTANALRLYGIAD